jgi:ketosteroid isomerase-like protein
VSSTNSDLVCLATEAWNERGDEALIAYLDPEVEWHPPAESMEPGVYRGHDQVRDYLGRLGEIFDQRHGEILEVAELDTDVVIATVRMHGRSAKFGAEVDTTWTWLVTVQGGKTTRVEIFLHKTDALAAYERRTSTRA